jgi:hypothetical protein
VRFIVVGVTGGAGSVGVMTDVVEATAPPEPVTVSVYVLAEVNAGVRYEAPLTAAGVISELLTPVDPITAVPPEKVGINSVDVLYNGVDVLETRPAAIGTVAAGATMHVVEATAPLGPLIVNV